MHIFAFIEGHASTNYAETKAGAEALEAFKVRETTQKCDTRDRETCRDINIEEADTDTDTAHTDTETRKKVHT